MDASRRNRSPPSGSGRERSCARSSPTLPWDAAGAIRVGALATLANVRAASAAMVRARFLDSDGGRSRLSRAPRGGALTDDGARPAPSREELGNAPQRRVDAEPRRSRRHARARCRFDRDAHHAADARTAALARRRQAVLLKGGSSRRGSGSMRWATASGVELLHRAAHRPVRCTEPAARLAMALAACELAGGKPLAPSSASYRARLRARGNRQALNKPVRPNRPPMTPTIALQKSRASWRDHAPDRADYISGIWSACSRSGRQLLRNGRRVFLRNRRSARVYDQEFASIPPKNSATRATTWWRCGLPPASIRRRRRSTCNPAVSRNLSELHVLLSMITPISWLDFPRADAQRADRSELGCRRSRRTASWDIRCCSCATSRSFVASSCRSGAISRPIWSSGREVGAPIQSSLRRRRADSSSEPQATFSEFPGSAGDRRAAR